jgi:glutamyl/glutaminyl-tRNA synthetase
MPVDAPGNNVVINGGAGNDRIEEVGQANQAHKAEKAGAAGEVGLRKLTADDILKLGGGEPQAPKQIRVRFAPSPTGHLHIGGARTALVNFLFAQANGGKFVLRIEDTDQMRSKPEFTEAILEGLRWLGLKWDEEPIFQSQRTDIYKAKVQQLIDAGKARVDPETKAVYFIMPKDGKIVINDRLKGRVEVDPEPDFVIQRADGSPMFLLANVVDDVEQGITHIFRGDDHLTNAAKQIELFRALGFEVPEFFHMPLIHDDPKLDDEDPKKSKPGGKLSKRHGAVSVIDYQRQGFSPIVLVNHLARMGMGIDGQDTFSLDALVERFDPTRLSKKESVLGLTQLAKLADGTYVQRPGPLLERMFREIMSMPTAAVAQEIKAILADKERVEAHITDPGSEGAPGFFHRTGVTAAEAREALNLSDEQVRALADGGKKRFSTFMDAIDFAAILRAPLRYDPKDAVALGGAKVKAQMKTLMGQLDRIPAGDWKLETLSKALDDFNANAKVKYQAYGKSLRWMLTGNPQGFPLHNTMVLLGKEETLRRLQEMTKEA